ncbi:carbohydrate ABC transporter membrane protein 1 (CUT1 family) [Melghirimyces profundicolus]|uniref:Carbohydrate ABC transporter membrane protein 1 (CUT1 family) n=1 Tax=Melghirimyces profundicolus TaxID=1242148 RepID=A0A2T6AZA5_9BACL|nr:ABC transporter permease subunit [Melghirimyces profundicolus]PTX49149.1 carbohydrate ABC transporter membrane protein 1 (CUT1 family) [Melghirimyces profundicolus]
MKKRNRRGLSERNLGYLLVLPAMILILVIAIYPVVRSFWLSLYDVRLNDPTKLETHSNYGIDVERYANSMPFLISSLNKEIGKAEEGNKDRLTSAKEKVEKARSVLESNPQLAEQYKKVDEILFEGKNVPENLQFVELQEEKAQEATQLITEARKELKALEKAEALDQPKRVVGLSNGLLSSFIEPNFVGLKYYEKYFKDPRMWDSLNNTVVFTVISVALELVFGLAIALLINRQFFGRGLVRASVLIPWALPTAVAALMWKFMFDGQNGVMAKIFTDLGLIPDMGTLLTTKFWSMFAVIFADVWKTTPFMALLLLAGLQTIPNNLYEAAEVDGASKIQQFFKITLPMLRTTILVALLFRTLDAFRVFDLIFVLTGGGPANATETISVYAYKTMFAQMNFGAGSALAVIVFFCIAIISILFVKLLGRDLISDGSGK